MIPSWLVGFMTYNFKIIIPVGKMNGTNKVGGH